MKNIYDFFGDIVCITLKETQERKKHVEKLYKQYNIPGRFFVTQKHPLGGLYGCFDSHINVIKEAYDNNIEYLLIFEDDFKPTSQYNEKLLSKAIEFMKNNDDWEVFFLGHLNVGPSDIYNVNAKTIFSSKKISDNIIEFNPYGAQALCYNRKCMKKILEEYKYYIGFCHYDDFLSAKLKLKSYCICPILFDQNLYFNYNIEAQDPWEYILRKSYPFFQYFKINENVSFLHYKMSCSDFEYMWMYKYLVIIIILIILNIIKNLIMYRYNPISRKKNELKLPIKYRKYE